MSVKFLTRMEAESWCLKNGIHVVGGMPKPHERSRIPAFKIPEDAGARTSLARSLYPNAEDGELLIWTTDWSVWPSGEHLPLMSRLREALGENRDVFAAPAQLVDSESTDDGKSLLILNLLFLWDCWVISSRGEYVVFFSHDECGELYVVPETRRSAVKDLLKGMRLFTN